MRLLLLTALATAALAPSLALADEVIVVPFGGELAGDRALGDELAAATAEVLELAPATDARVAEVPRLDILTLAACPDGARDCIGQLAATLDVDRAATGVIAATGDRLDIELRVVYRDGVVLTHAIRLERAERSLVVGRFKTALAQKLGLARPAPAVAAPLATPRPRAAPASDGPRRSVRARTWAVLGAGVIGLGLGTAFLLKAEQTEDQIRAAPAETSDDIRALRELEDRGDSEKTTGAAMLVIGGVATAAAAALIAWDLAVGPASPSGEGVAVTVRGSF